MPQETLNINPFMTHRTVHLFLKDEILQKCRNKLLLLEVSMQSLLTELCLLYSENDKSIDEIVNKFTMKTVKEKIESEKNKAIENERKRLTGKENLPKYTRIMFGKTIECSVPEKPKPEQRVMVHVVLPKEILQKCKTKLIFSDMTLQTLLAEFCRLYSEDTSCVCSIATRLSNRLAKFDVENVKDKVRKKEVLERERLLGRSTINSEVLYRLISENDDEEEKKID